jgi:hypothetical protein
MYHFSEANIICQSEGYKLGIASNHSDVMRWFPRHGETMDTFRAAVKKGLAGAPCSLDPSGDLYIVQVDGDDVLNVRDGPSAGAAKRTALAKGSLVHVLETSDNGWRRIKADTVTGWVNGKYLASCQTYTIERGDSLQKIAAKFGVPWRDLGEINNITPPQYTIIAGHSLVIPKGA